MGGAETAVPLAAEPPEQSMSEALNHECAFSLRTFPKINRTETTFVDQQ